MPQAEFGRNWLLGYAGEGRSHRAALTGIGLYPGRALVMGLKIGLNLRAPRGVKGPVNIGVQVVFQDRPGGIHFTLRR